MINKLLKNISTISSNIYKASHLKFQKTLFSTTRLKNTNNNFTFPSRNYEYSFEDKVNYIEKYLRNKLKEGYKDLLEDDKVKKVITEIDNTYITDEVVLHPVLVNKTINSYCMLKMVPNTQLIKVFLKYLENQNPFLYYSRFKQVEILRFLENLVLIMNALSKKNIYYYKISNILCLLLNSFRAKLVETNNYKLISFLINFNKSGTKFYNICIQLIISLTKQLNDLTLKQCLSILCVASHQNIFNFIELNLILDKVMKYDLEKETNTDENFLLLLNYLNGYSINYIEKLGHKDFQKFFIDHNRRIFYDKNSKKELTLKEYMEYHYYFYLIGDIESLRITSENFVNLSNMNLFCHYNMILNSFNILTKDNIDSEENLSDLMSLFIKKLNCEEIIGDNSYIRTKILFAVFNSSSIFQKKLKQTSFFNLMTYHDLFFEIAYHFRLTLQILPLLGHLKSIDEKKLNAYFTQFFKDHFNNSSSQNLRLKNVLLMMFSSNIIIDEKLLQEFISSKLLNNSDEESDKAFLLLEQKLLYNSVLYSYNEKYGTNYNLYEIEQPEIDLKNNVLFYDYLKIYIKKVRYALYLNERYIIDNIFYIDYYIPTMKIGFFLVSEKNIYENTNYYKEVDQCYKIYKDLIKRKYDIDLIFIEENMLLNHSEILTGILNKCLGK